MDKNDERAARQLLDRQEIYDCLLRYTRGMDRLDPDSVISAFHPDASANGGTREELAAGGVAMHSEENRYTQHCLTNHYCELDGDLANAETYFVYFGAREREATDVLGGRYIDEFERRDGEWRLSKRIVLVEWSSSLPLGKDIGTSPSTDAPEAMNDPRSRRSREDASYIRPLPVNTVSSLA
ncbi:MAG: nuclear transport factor 2 family protein [Rhodospirillaceae bacterium]|nr:nuclear transport factor 2 family protein [Rhodospirillaceae bacterium]MDE0362772.1 nuclear transport factor 2 family protein [Rhodospirillaceae bacterium]